MRVLSHCITAVEPRTATVVTVNRCAMLSITKENFQIFFEEAPEALADFEIKLARYQVSVDGCAYVCTGMFQKFCG